jgi:hypothetical protein
MSEKSKAVTKCYMCDGANEGREHVPAFTFFPKGYKRQSVDNTRVHDNTIRTILKMSSTWQGALST